MNLNLKTSISVSDYDWQSNTTVIFAFLVYH